MLHRLVPPVGRGVEAHAACGWAVACVARQLASLGSSGGLGGAITPLEHTNSNVTSSSSSCTSTSASSDAAGSSGTTAPVDDTTSTSYRRGFGAKVALPATDVLQMPLVETPATIRFRAYHVGSRIHIGKLLTLLDERHGAMDTTSGKDYAILWLGDSSTRLFAGHCQQQEQQPGSFIGMQMPRLPAAVQQALRSGVSRLQQMPRQPLSAIHQQLLDLVKQQGQGQHEVQQQAQQQPSAAGSTLQPPWRAPPAAAAVVPPAAPAPVPPLMAVYRMGSIVFAGTRREDEARLLAALVPPSVRYAARAQTAWPTVGAGASGGQLAPAAAEEHVVVVAPGLSQEAVKGMDQVQIRVLDVGSVRVLTSVLAQSAALAFYERSVSESLSSLYAWRTSAMQPGAAARQRRGVATRLLTLLSSGQQDTVLFKVIAASALVIEESRRLLEMAEPAWTYDRYNDLWHLMAGEFELEQRFRTLEIKLNQVEREAKHDVKNRAGRRYQKLEQSVVWLLVVSCLLAAFGVGKRAVMASWLAGSAANGDPAVPMACAPATPGGRGEAEPQAAGDATRE